ncbi:hypothetical protein PR048_009126 [Dryococelus australis]|uniref:Uncharacterized protein n=1 Tax=Dryococelus australis TaxID=614101 RepID=A0ABQ9HZT1_9NEOP|nr:hypothetical protein PR048_009126 [Dryococelus australis]
MQCCCANCKAAEMISEAELIVEDELIAKVELIVEAGMIANAELVAELIAKVELIVELIAEAELIAEVELIVKAELIERNFDRRIDTRNNQLAMMQAHGSIIVETLTHTVFGTAKSTAFTALTAISSTSANSSALSSISAITVVNIAVSPAAPHLCYSGVILESETCMWLAAGNHLAARAVLLSDSTPGTTQRRAASKVTLTAQLIGPFQLPDSMNGEFYFVIKTNHLPEMLHDVDLETCRKMTFQNDGSPHFLNRKIPGKWTGHGDLIPIIFFGWGYYKELVYSHNSTHQLNNKNLCSHFGCLCERGYFHATHFIHNVRQRLNHSFRGRWIGRGGPVAWLAPSLDLNPLDVYLWGHCVCDVQTLEQRVRVACDDIRVQAGTIERVRQSMMRRVDACIASNGGHFKHLFFLPVTERQLPYPLPSPTGAAVAQWLEFPSPINVNRVRFPTRPFPDFYACESFMTIQLFGGLSRRFLYFHAPCIPALLCINLALPYKELAVCLGEAKTWLGKVKEVAGIAERRMEGARVCEAELVAICSYQTVLDCARAPCASLQYSSALVRVQT